jgi:hypothetical protein
MPKASGANMRTITAPPKKMPSRGILHGFGTPPGPRTLPSAQGALKAADRLRPSPQKSGPAGGKMWPQRVF